MNNSSEVPAWFRRFPDSSGCNGKSLSGNKFRNRFYLRTGTWKFWLVKKPVSGLLKLMVPVWFRIFRGSNHG